MFVGREEELNELESLYNSDKFQMIIMYGRRRVGKTTLIQKFLENHNACFFAAQEANDKINLDNFSIRTNTYFNRSGYAPFASWNNAIDFWIESSMNQRHILVIDEFPYACEANAGLQSIIQNAVDHGGKSSKLFIILCGSQVSFMENEVMGHKSPLFGRRTSSMKIEPFDYFDTGRMLPKSSYRDKIRYYSCLGGTPYYLSMIDEEQSFEKNMQKLMFHRTGFLYDEPILLLKQELREPAVYNSILTAVAGSAARSNEIAARIGEDTSKLTRYFNTLMELDLLEKHIPFGDNPEKSRKGIYKISDNFYQFWYLNIFNNRSEIEDGSGEYVAEVILDDSNLNHYIGNNCFEKIAEEYLKRLNKAGKLEIRATSFGKWWGNDKELKKQNDIDMVAANKFTKEVLLCECKWRNAMPENEDIRKLLNKSHLLPGYKKYFYRFISQMKIDEPKLSPLDSNIKFTSLSDLFEI